MVKRAQQRSGLHEAVAQAPDVFFLVVFVEIRGDLFMQLVVVSDGGAQDLQQDPLEQQICRHQNEIGDKEAPERQIQLAQKRGEAGRKLPDDRVDRFRQTVDAGQRAEPVGHRLDRADQLGVQPVHQQAGDHGVQHGKYGHRKLPAAFRLVEIDLARAQTKQDERYVDQKHFADIEQDIH